MSSSTIDPAGPWRFDDLAALPDGGRRYEVVDAHLVVTLPPSQDHQLVAGRLREQMAAACPSEWEVVQEYALPLGRDGRVPDLAVVRRRALSGGTSPYPQGPEDFGLVVEISSPSTRKTDLFPKPGSTRRPASRCSGASSCNRSLRCTRSASRRTATYRSRFGAAPGPCRGAPRSSTCTGC